LQFAKSPWHFVKYKQGVRSETKAMRMGSLMHVLVCEQETFAGKYAVCDMRRDVRTKAYQDFLAVNTGKIILSASEHETAANFAQALTSNSIAAGLIRLSKTEVDATRDIEGIIFRGRADLVLQVDGSIIVGDLKTAQNIEPNKWASKVLNERLHWQAWIYKKLFGASQFFHIAAESTAPYGSCVYELPDVFLELATIEIMPLLDKFKECAEENKWEMHEKQDLPTPRWVHSAIENQLGGIMA
jgi:ATP-dependent exoDNAse (exonuclease V) beta subunit